MIQILFEPPTFDEEGVEGGDVSEFNALRYLSSCLTPDLTTLTLSDGKLDSAAISDCAQFVQAVIGSSRDRGANSWGILLYFMITLNFLAQADSDEMIKLLDYVTHHVSRTAYIVSKHTSRISQFILCVNLVRTELSSNVTLAEDKCIFWHNYRTDQKPEGAPTGFDTGAVQGYYAFRLESVINVINKVMKKSFKHAEIVAAVNSCDAASFGRAYFYDISKSPWPIIKQEVDQVTNTCVSTPLSEEELLSGTMERHRALFIKKNFFDEIVRDSESGGKVVHDPKDVIIKSNNAGYPDYNFWDQVVGGEDVNLWYGFRVAGETSFRNFCGWDNLMYIGSPLRPGLEMDADLEQRNADLGFGSDASELYSPKNLSKLFGYSYINPDDLPFAIRYDPFVYRNELTDTKMPYVKWDDSDDYDSGDDKNGTKDSVSTFDPKSPGSSPVDDRVPLGDITNTLDDALGGGESEGGVRTLYCCSSM